MSIKVDIDLQGLVETEKLLAEFEGRPLNNRLRRSMRAGAKVFREEYRRQASARSDLPRTMRKTRTRSHERGAAVSVAPASPLAPIFDDGARGHLIGAPGQLLANQGAGFIARGPVSHPGMAARPITTPVFERAESDAEEAVADSLFEGIR